jgi:hypothetical protein
MGLFGNEGMELFHSLALFLPNLQITGYTQRGAGGGSVMVACGVQTPSGTHIICSESVLQVHCLLGFLFSWACTNVRGSTSLNIVLFIFTAVAISVHVASSFRRWIILTDCLYVLVYPCHGLWTNKTDSVALVCERTIPTEPPPLVSEDSANFCG